MAEAENKLGQLFVELGIDGGKGALQMLNGIQAQFLLTKNAAQQFLKPIIDVNKKLGENAVSLDKINSVTGISIKNLQDLKYWSKLNDVDFNSFIGTLENLQQKILDIQMGKGDIQGLALLGIDPRELNYKEPLEALKLISQRVEQVDEATGNYALRTLGLSADLLYAFKQNNGEIDQRLKLTEKEIGQLGANKKAWNEWEATVEAAINKAASKTTWLTDLITKASKVLTILSVGSAEDRGTLYVKAVDTTKQKIANTFSGKNTGWGFQLGQNIAKEIKAYQTARDKQQKGQLKPLKRQSSIGSYAHPFASQMKPINITDDYNASQDMYLPPNLKASQQFLEDNRTINNNVYIRSTEPIEAGREVREAIAPSLKYSNINGGGS